MTRLPTSVLGFAERTPAEDLVLAILRDYLPDVAIQSLLDDDQQFPVVLARRSPTFGVRDPDPRFIDFATVAVSVFVDGVEADSDGAILSDAVRKAFFAACSEQRVYPGLGHLHRVRMVSAPKRVTDWASSVGPVQYADLPIGVLRYESAFDLEIRIPNTPFYSTL